MTYKEYSTASLRWTVAALLSILLFLLGVIASPYLAGIAIDAELGARLDAMESRADRADARFERLSEVQGQLHIEMATEVATIKATLRAICEATDAKCP